jgi:type IV fimbrial biogenesis protein FimT
MVVLTIGGILLGLAVPSYSYMVRTNRLTADANYLITSFNIARSEAINRRSTITVCPSSNQTSCTGGGWKDGWIVLDGGKNEVIRIFDAMKGSPTITSSAGTVQYTSSGFISGGAAVTIGICMGAGDQGRQINITATGRPNNVTPYPTC